MNIRMLRRITQLSTLAMMIAIPILNLRRINILAGSFYSLAIGPIWITDPLSGLQVMLITLTADTSLLLSIALPVALTFVFGRVFCGWMCPQNFLSELLDYIRQAFSSGRVAMILPSPKMRYLVLAAMLLLALLLGFPVANLISAPGIISVQISELIMTGAVGMELSLIGAISLIEFFMVRRFWCNLFCPVGGLLGIFRTAKTLKVVHLKEKDQCIKCGDCVKACQLGLNPMGGKIYPLCHNCGDCIAACHRKTDKDKPLSFRF